MRYFCLACKANNHDGCITKAGSMTPACECPCNDVMANPLLVWELVAAVFRDDTAFGKPVVNGVVCTTAEEVLFELRRIGRP